jgi:hypothetical protein
MQTTNANGQTRKNLASQLDRLDHILDGLADGLNEAVAGAVKEAVGLAVQQSIQAVLAEVLTNPDLLVMLRGLAALPATDPDATAPPSGPRLGQRLGRVVEKVASGVRAAARACCQAGRQVRQSAENLLHQAGQACATLCRPVRRFAASAWGICRASWPYKSRVLLAVGVAASAGPGAYAAGPWLAAVTGGLGGPLLTNALRGACALQRQFAEWSAGWAVRSQHNGPRASRALAA